MISSSVRVAWGTAGSSLALAHASEVTDASKGVPQCLELLVWNANYQPKWQTSDTLLCPMQWYRTRAKLLTTPLSFYGDCLAVTLLCGPALFQAEAVCDDVLRGIQS